MLEHDLSLLTVIYGNYTVLEDFFGSLDRQTDKDFHLYIADLTENKKTINAPSYATVIAGPNRGYAYGINLGLEKAMKKSGLYCVLNSDTTLPEDFTANVRLSLENHPDSVIGGKIYYAQGYEYHKRYEKNDLGKILWYAGGNTDWEHVLSRHRGVDEADRGQYDRFEPTGFITGCLMAYNRRVAETVGSWDESYFLYFEDADFCARAKSRKIPLYYDPKIVMWHKVSQSTGGSGSAFQVKYQERNRLRFGLKYAPIRTKLHLLKNALIQKLR